MRHLIDITDLTVEEIDQLIATAEDIIENPVKYQDVAAHKQLATLFFEPSTRTRLSFESAMLGLGGSVLGFSSAASSSTAKGETVTDTVRTVSCYADIIAMRHPKEGAPFAASQRSQVPIINAGDGGHNHPTQTLTDLLTIHRERGSLENFTIGFCGDLKFGRTVHSLVNALSRYSNIHFIFISPEELKMPNYINELKENLNFYRENGGVKRFVYYNGVADKVLNYYSKLETPLENWDGKSLNYFDLQRDSQSYKVTDLDCVRLFLLIDTTVELKSLLGVINFLFKEPSEFKEVIARLNA